MGAGPPTQGRSQEPRYQEWQVGGEAQIESQEEIPEAGEGEKLAGPATPGSTCTPHHIWGREGSGHLLTKPKEHAGKAPMTDPPYHQSGTDSDARSYVSL